MKSSIDEGVSKYKLYPSNNLILLNGDSLILENAWVEAGWSYESINGEIEIEKKKYDNIILKIRDFDLSMYDKYDIKIDGRYLDWNGVLFESLKVSSDTIEIIFNNDNMNDRLFILQLFKQKSR